MVKMSLDAFAAHMLPPGPPPSPTSSPPPPDWEEPVAEHNNGSDDASSSSSEDDDDDVPPHVHRWHAHATLEKPHAPIRKVTVIGCGCIGGYIGGSIAALGGGSGDSTVPTPLVSFLLSSSARSAALATAVREQGGLILKAGRSRPLLVPHASFHMDPKEALARTDLVVVATKRGANEALRDTLAAHCPSDVPVLLCQNGLDAAADFAPRARTFQVIVTMNVVSSTSSPATFTLTSPLPKLTIAAAAEEACLDRAVRRGAELGLKNGFGDASEASLVTWLDRAGFHVTVAPPDAISRFQRGKVIINMFNAPNALCGRPTLSTLVSRAACRLVAASMAEALACFEAEARHSPRSSSSPSSSVVEPRWAVLAASLVFRLLSFWAVNRLLLHLLSVAALLLCRWGLLWEGRPDKLLPLQAAHSSMWEDFHGGAAVRSTEVGLLNGAIVDMGLKYGVATPANAALLAAVRSVESGAVPRTHFSKEERLWELLR
jgi:ketopantoate reductase